MPRRLRRSMLAMLLTLAVAGAGCDRFARSNEEAEPQDSAVGEAIDEASGTPTTASAGERPASGGPASAGPAPTAALPTNQRVADHPDGWRILLTVDGDLRYGTGEDIVLKVEAENAGSGPLVYDPNDLTNFVFRVPGSNQVRWSDGNCRAARTPDALQTQAQTLGPTEHVSFVDRYPGPPERDDRDSCRIGAGRWEVVGYVTACPADALDSRGRCDRTKTRQVASPPLAIVIG